MKILEVMNDEPDNSANTRWRRANYAYKHYQAYIAAKPDRYHLSFVDLIFVKNFKGGSATIDEPASTFDSKIEIYEAALRKFADRLASNDTLSSLSDVDFIAVREEIVSFARIPEYAPSHISGFGVSFASALLHFYFPLVVPILDRRVVNGSSINEREIKVKGGVVINLLDLYPALIGEFRERLQRDNKLTVRELDLELFKKKLRPSLFSSKSRD